MTVQYVSKFPDDKPVECEVTNVTKHIIALARLDTRGIILVSTKFYSEFITEGDMDELRLKLSEYQTEDSSKNIQSSKQNVRRRGKKTA